VLENPPAANARLRRAAKAMPPAELNEFLVRYAHQSHDQGGAKTFLVIGSKTKIILGFYSVAPASLVYDRVPTVARGGLAHHEVPGFRLARLAVDRAEQGRGLGVQLLLAAGRRCVLAAQAVGGTVLVIDAKNDRAAAWYASYGAIPLVETERTLVLPLATIENLLRGEGKLRLWA
jgi:GNAT superfamily N-acetyltransferase